MKERVKSVRNYRKPAFWIITVAVIVCMAVVLCLLTGPVRPEEMGAAGSANFRAEDVSLSDGVNIESAAAQNLLVWEDVDLDQDGEKETIYVREVIEGELYELEVAKKDGTVLWSAEAGIPHVGWNTILLYQQNGRAYLVQYLPTMYQGIGSYTCAQMTFEDGQAVEENVWAVDFELPVQEMSDEMKAFEEAVNAIMEESTVLLSTAQGELVVGPKPAAEVSQLYPVWLGTDGTPASANAAPAEAPIAD